MRRYKIRSGFLLMAMGWLLPSLATAQQFDPQLEALIKKGIEKNHSLSINSLEAEQARVDQKLAKAVFLPKVTLNGNFTRLNDDIRFDEDTESLLIGSQKLLIKEAAGLPFNAPFPASIPVQEVPSIQDQNILKSSADLDWVLFSGFEATNAYRASKHKEASLNYAGLAEKDKLALKIIETYDQLGLVNASEQVLRTSEKYLDQQIHYVRKAIENGLATPIDRKKLELAQQQLAAKQLQFTNSKTLLIELLHQLTGEDRERLRLLEPKLQTMLSNEQIPDEKRNEIKALEEAEQASLFKAKMEKSNYIPKLGLKGHYEFLEQDLSLLDPIWYVGVGIKWNIFDGNQAALKSKKSLLESQKYREQRKDAEEMIALSIVQARLNYEAAQQNTVIVQKEVELARDTYDLTQKQYENALASVNEVLDALSDLEKAGFKLQESYFSERRTATALLHAKGALTY